MKRTLLFLAVLFVVAGAQAQTTRTYVGAGETPAWDYQFEGLFKNWSGDVLPLATENVFFGSGSHGKTVFLNGDRTVNGLEIDGDYDFTLSGSGLDALKITSGYVYRDTYSFESGVGQEITARMLLGNDSVFELYGGGELVVSGTIGRLNAESFTTFTKTGYGRLVLQAANTFGDEINVSQGVLRVENDNVFLSSATLNLGTGDSENYAQLDLGPSRVVVDRINLYRDGDVMQSGNGYLDANSEIAVRSGEWNFGSSFAIRAAREATLTVDGGTANIQNGALFGDINIFDGIANVYEASGVTGGYTLRVGDGAGEAGTAVLNVGDAYIRPGVLVLEGDGGIVANSLPQPGAFSGIGAIGVTEGLVVNGGAWTAGNVPFQAVLTANLSELSQPLIGFDSYADFVEVNGGSLTLVGENHYGGPTTVNGGLLNITAAAALPSTTTLTIGQFGGAPESATVDLMNNTINVAGLTLYQSGVITGVTPGETTINISSRLTFGDGTRTFNPTTDTLLRMADTAALAVLSGDLTLQGNNTFTGGVELYGSSVLHVVSDANLGAAAGGITLSGESTLALGGAFSSARNIVLRDNTPNGVTINDGGFDSVFTGAISQLGNAATLNKTGAGRMTFSGASSYAGDTVVKQGTLVAQNSSPFGTSKVTVNSGAQLVLDYTAGIANDVALKAGSKLAGTGSTTGTVTTETTAVIAPGFSAGVMTLGGLNANGGGVFDFELGTASDRLNVTGLFSALGEGKLLVNVYDAGGFTAKDYLLIAFGSQYDLAANDFVLGAMPSGYLGSFLVNANDVTLSVTAVPEPSTLALGAAGAAMLWLGRRNRKAKAGK